MKLLMGKVHISVSRKSKNFRNICFGWGFFDVERRRSMVWVTCNVGNYQFTERIEQSTAKGIKSELNKYLGKFQDLVAKRVKAE